MRIQSSHACSDVVLHTRQPFLFAIKSCRLIFAAQACLAFILVALVASPPTLAAIENLSIVPDDRLTHPVNPVARNFGIWTEHVGEGGASPSTTNDALILSKVGFKGSDYQSCFGTRYHHPQHVVRLPNKNGYAYFASTHSDSEYNAGTATYYPAGRMTVYKSQAPVDANDQVVKNPTGNGVDGLAVWEDIFNYAGGNNAQPNFGFNHPGKMQVIGGLLIVSMEQWDGFFCQFDGSGVADDAVFFYDVRDPENPQYWGRLTATELGTGAPINDVEIFQVGDLWVLKVLSKFFTATDVSPEISAWTEVGSAPEAFGFNEKSQGRVIDSYEVYNDNPDWLLGGLPVGGPGNPWDSGAKRPIFYNAEEDTSNLVGGDEVIFFHSVCINSPSAPECLRPGVEPLPGQGLVIGIGQPQDDNRYNRSAPNINAGTIDYDAGSIYVSGGRPIIYAFCIDCGGPYDVISRVYDNRNRYLTLPQAIEGVSNSITSWNTGGQGDWFANWDDDSILSGNLARTTKILDGEQAFIETNVSGTGILEFDWKVSSEINDYLRFELDGAEILDIVKISGSNGWEHHTLIINTAGSHNFKWTYEKNGSVATGADIAYLDNVSFTPNFTAYVVTNPSGYSQVGSLRYGIEQGYENISFSSSFNGARITLLSPLALTQDINISAANLPDGLVLDGDNSTQIFQISSGITVSIEGLTISRGSVTGNGAAIVNDGSILNVTDSTFIDNHATAYGGAIINFGGTTTIDNCSFINNSADFGGGALYNGNLAITNTTVINSTFSGNSSENGGAIQNYQGVLSLVHSTVVGNSATGWSGGIFNNGAGVSFSLENSIVAENTDVNGRPDIHSGTAAISTGQNFIGNNSGSTIVAGPFVGTAVSPLNPMLTPLANNGGLSRTMLPSFGSPVLDAAIVASPATIIDQRLVLRPQGAAPDIGAVEFIDDDSDGVDNSVDSFPLDPTEWIDTDRDGLGNNADTDDDNDSIPDSLELLTGRDPLVVDWMVTARGLHSCALDDSGVKCWGNNINGQTTVPPLVNPVSVSAGRFYTCALDDNGVTCWGSIVYAPPLINPVAISAGFNHACALDDNGVTCWAGSVLQNYVPPLINPVAVSVGESHSCALDDNGVICWGSNNDGQTTVPQLINLVAISAGWTHSCALDDSGVTCWGTGKTNTGVNAEFGQSIVPPLVNPIAISAGFLHSCALDDGGVICWGSNSDGQTTVPRLNNPIAVVAGFNHSCALDDSGVVCWGDDYLGATLVPDLAFDKDGDGVNDNDDALPLDPAQSIDTDRDGVGNNTDSDDDNDSIPDSLELLTGRDPLLANWMLDAGFNHNCVLDDNGVTCWGNNPNGEATVPVAPPLINPLAVSAGNNHSCALDDSGVVCWGSDTYGQVTVPGSLGNLVAVSAGGIHSCALSDTGVVTCWGYNGQGQTTVPALINPVMVSAAGNHTCALDDSGVSCWGYNGFGQTTVPILRNPVAISAGGFQTCALDDIGVICWGDNGAGQTTVPGLINPAMISAGTNHTCALDENGVKCWGSNSDGQTTVPLLINPVAVSAGQLHSCALDDNGVTCWGSNGFGQTTASGLAFDKDGDGVDDSIDALPFDPTESIDTDGDGIGNNVDSDDDNDTIPDSLELQTGRDPLAADWMLDAGGSHSCALDDSGVKCWGYNGQGQTTVSALSNPTLVSSGSNHNCALDDNGVSCWGYNGQGQTTVPVPALSNPVTVSAGGNQTCALDDNGVSCWGSDLYDESIVPGTLLNPFAVSAGGTHSCALDDSGVVCWGYNYYGQAPALTPVLSNPVAVSAGGSHTCTLDDIGVKCWGDNEQGQSAVPLLSNPTMISAGGLHTCVLDDGVVKCWGYNNSGQTDVPPLVNPVAVSAGSLHTCALDERGVTCWGLNLDNRLIVPVLAFDKDQDGLLDRIEDANGNGVVDVGETDPLNIDSDNDGLVDGAGGGILLLSYPNGIDSDGDGYVDGELDHGTNPNNSDSDNDLVPDGVEVAAGTDPNNIADSTVATANDDAEIVAQNAPPTAINVLVNDNDPDETPVFTIVSVTQPANGTVVIDGNGLGLTYEPNPDYSNDGATTDDFTYTLTPGGATATVSVRVLTSVMVPALPVAGLLLLMLVLGLSGYSSIRYKRSTLHIQ